MVFECSPLERIPLIEMVLTMGANTLAQEGEFPLNIIREFLHFKADSLNEKLLLAFLRVIPEHERTVTISYMLGRSGESDEAGSTRALFEIFQSVGIKLGQLASIWNLFGNDVSRDLRGLKDNARPMSRSEIESVMVNTLNPSELFRIKLKRVLGSASMKTVVEVELDGRRAVMMVQRPQVKAQIASSLRLGASFLTELQSLGVKLPAALLLDLIEPLDEQLEQEVRMTLEASKTDRVRLEYQAIAGSLGGVSNGWQIEVPRIITDIPVRDNLMFMEFAEGIPFDELDARLQAEVGPLLAQSSLQLLFRRGIFDPDRHLGNWLFDPDRKVVRAYDFGQLEEYERTGAWQWDDRLAIARFLQGLDSSRADWLVDAALHMTRPELRNALDRTELIRAVERASSTFRPDASIQEQVTTLVSTLSEQGLKLERRFLLGALRGLLVLAGEGYVSPNRLHEELRTEVKRTLALKSPVLAKERLTRRRAGPTKTRARAAV